jgi:glutamate synthase (NADPH/NADH) large chain
MSGGIAYVYDVTGNFASLCNMEMIDLDPLSHEDAAQLQQMISNHYTLTGSTVAKFVLDDFDNQLHHFVKVFPKDYKAALQTQKSKVKSQN